MRILLLALLATLSLPASAQPSASWSAKPWLDDLTAIRAALDSKYANRDWLAQVRQIDLDAVTTAAAARIATAGSDAEARRIIDQMLSRFHDGHVEVEWPPTFAPTAAAKEAPSAPTSICGSLGFEAHPNRPIGPALPGHVALADDGVFPAGTFALAGSKVGILRINEFQPNGAPALCAAAEKALVIADDAPCEDACQDRLMAAIYDDFTRRFAARLVALRAAGANALMIDLTNNGGGSEWAEAAARMVSAMPLTSERLGFVRGAHWVKHWHDLAEELTGHLAKASAADKAALSQWIATAKAAEREAGTACAFGSGCTWLGRAGFVTGLVGAAPAGALKGKPWGPSIFSPAQYDYADGVWSGPLIILVNDETWSAAEEFAAMLQDSHAALIVGARTGGAGCGHTDGGTPTTLPNSDGVLALPDCARLRPDGSNEISGVIPDVLVPWRYYDSPARAAALLMTVLPQAIERAISLR